MKKLIPCMLAGFILVGLFSVCITSFLAPSDNYIQDTLEPTEEPFYFVLNPVSQSVVSNDGFSISAYTNLPGTVYTWQYLSYDFDILNNNYYWHESTLLNFDGVLYRPPFNSAVRNFYRCVATNGDRVIYSSPCFISAFPDNQNFKSSNFDKFQEGDILYLPDTNLKTEFEESEVIE